MYRICSGVGICVEGVDFVKVIDLTHHLPHSYSLPWWGLLKMQL